MTTQPTSDDTYRDSDRDALRARLQREFHITALFVPVKTVACVLGLSPSTIYAYIRGDAFFLPYCLMNKTPMIALDDLVDWCLRSSERRAPTFAQQPNLVRTELPDRTSKIGLCESEDISPVDRAVAEAMSQLGFPARRRSVRPR